MADEEHVDIELEVKKDEVKKDGSKKKKERKTTIMKREQNLVDCGSKGSKFNPVLFSNLEDHDDQKLREGLLDLDTMGRLMVCYNASNASFWKFSKDFSSIRPIEVVTVKSRSQCIYRKDSGLGVAFLVSEGVKTFFMDYKTEALVEDIWKWKHLPDLAVEEEPILHVLGQDSHPILINGSNLNIYSLNKEMSLESFYQQSIPETGNFKIRSANSGWRFVIFNTEDTSREEGTAHSHDDEAQEENTDHLRSHRGWDEELSLEVITITTINNRPTATVSMSLGRRKPISEAKFSTINRDMLVFAAGAEMEVWKSYNGFFQLQGILKGHQQNIIDFDMSPDHTIVSIGKDYQIRFWDALLQYCSGMITEYGRSNLMVQFIGESDPQATKFLTYETNNAQLKVREKSLGASNSTPCRKLDFPEMSEAKHWENIAISQTGALIAFYVPPDEDDTSGRAVIYQYAGSRDNFIRHEISLDEDDKYLYESARSGDKHNPQRFKFQERDDGQGCALMVFSGDGKEVLSLALFHDEGRMEELEIPKHACFAPFSLHYSASTSFFVSSNRSHSFSSISVQINVRWWNDTSNINHYLPFEVPLDVHTVWLHPKFYYVVTLSNTQVHLYKTDGPSYLRHRELTLVKDEGTETILKDQITFNNDLNFSIMVNGTVSGKGLAYIYEIQLTDFMTIVRVLRLEGMRFSKPIYLQYHGEIISSMRENAMTPYPIVIPNATLDNFNLWSIEYDGAITLDENQVLVVEGKRVGVANVKKFKVQWLNGSRNPSDYKEETSKIGYGDSDCLLMASFDRASGDVKEIVFIEVNSMPTYEGFIRETENFKKELPMETMILNPMIPILRNPVTGATLLQEVVKNGDTVWLARFIDNARKQKQRLPLLEDNEGKTALDASLDPGDDHRRCFNMILRYAFEELPATMRFPITRLLPDIANVHQTAFKKILNDYIVYEKNRAPSVLNESNVDYYHQLQSEESMITVPSNATEPSKYPLGEYLPVNGPSKQMPFPCTSYHLSMPFLAGYGGSTEKMSEASLPEVLEAVADSSHAKDLAEHRKIKSALFLLHENKNEMKEVLSNDALFAVVLFKWNMFARSIFYKRAFLYLSFVILFALFSVLLALEDINASLFDVYLTDGLGIFRIVLQCFLLLYIVYFLREEFFQIRIEATEYLTSVWNLLDLCGYLLVLAIIPCHLVRSPSQWIVAAVANLILAFKLLGYARGFQNFGPFVKALFQVVSDIRYFIMILGLIVLAFALAFNLVIRTNSYNFQNIGLSIFSQYRMIFGEFDLVFDDGLDVLMDESMGLFVFSRVLYVGFSFSVSLILLNILIGIMGSSFERVQEEGELEWRWELLDMVVETENNYMWIDAINVHNFLRTITFGQFHNIVSMPRRSRTELNPRWIHVVMPKYNSPVERKEAEDVQKNATIASVTQKVGKRYAVKTKKLINTLRTEISNGKIEQTKTLLKMREDLEAMSTESKQMKESQMTLKTDIINGILHPTTVAMDDKDRTSGMSVSRDGLGLEFNDFATIRCTHGASSGKWLYEVKFSKTGDVGQIGWATPEAQFTAGNGCGDDAFGWGVDLSYRKCTWHNAEHPPYGLTLWKVGDVLGCYIDMDEGIIKFYLNGVDQGVAFTDVSADDLRPTVTMKNAAVEVNFGNRPFAFEIPNLKYKPFMLSANHKISGVTMNGADKTGQLRVVRGGTEVYSAQFDTARSNVGVKKGRWYYEATVASDGLYQIGWATRNASLESNANGVGDDENGYSVDLYRMVKWHAGSQEYGLAKWQAGDVVGCYLDLVENKIWFTLNGVDQGMAFTDVKVTSELHAAITVNENRCSVNFGAKPFKFPPNDEFQGLNKVSPDDDEEDATLSSLMKTLKAMQESINSLEKNIVIKR